MSDINSPEWSNIEVPIPESVFTYPAETQDSIYRYLLQLDGLEKKAYLIAKDHLGTSFHILRSTGYLSWLKK
jgi:enolase